MEDLNGQSGIRYGLYECYLVDESMRITSSYFNVWIPALMEGVEPGLSGGDLTIDRSTIMNEDDENSTPIETSVPTLSCIRAKSIHPYRHRHDGWIPEFNTETNTIAQLMVNGGGQIEAVAITGSMSSQTEPAGEGPHTHDLKAELSLGGGSGQSQFGSMVLVENVGTTIVSTNNTEVDYQELNRKFIKKGHKLYGEFVIGSQMEFVIVAIDNVVPYLDQTEDSGGNGDNPDTSAG